MVAREKCGTIAMVARKDGDTTGKGAMGERLVREESCASRFLVVRSLEAAEPFESRALRREKGGEI
jgi:hypothetical protein